MLDIYYGAMQAEPARLDIVIAVQADKTCLNIDLDYSRRFSTMFVDACRPFVDPSRHAALERICFMMFHLSHATVRLILSRDLDQARCLSRRLQVGPGQPVAGLHLDHALIRHCCLDKKKPDATMGVRSARANQQGGMGCPAGKSQQWRRPAHALVPGPDEMLDRIGADRQCRGRAQIVPAQADVVELVIVHLADVAMGPGDWPCA